MQATREATSQNLSCSLRPGLQEDLTVALTRATQRMCPPRLTRRGTGTESALRSVADS